MTESSIKHFEVIQPLGEGSYGATFLVRRLLDENMYCIKRIPILNLPPAEQKKAIDEAQFLAKIQSEYVVGYYDAFIELPSLYIVMEYADRGTLAEYIDRVRSKHDFIDEETIWRFFFELCLGMYQVHERKIVHRDLKTANIFLSGEDYQVKIGDFGVAKQLSTMTKMAETMIGTPYYLSPELVKGESYDQKSDVWSLGCIMYELVSLEKPFDAMHQLALIKKILEESPKRLPVSGEEGTGVQFKHNHRYSALLCNTVHEMLTKDPEQRPSIAEIFNREEIKEKGKELGFIVPPQRKKKGKAKKGKKKEGSVKSHNKGKGGEGGEDGADEKSNENSTQIAANADSTLTSTTATASANALSATVKTVASTSSLTETTATEVDAEGEDVYEDDFDEGILEDDDDAASGSANGAPDSGSSSSSHPSSSSSSSASKPSYPKAASVIVRPPLLSHTIGGSPKDNFPKSLADYPEHLPPSTRPMSSTTPQPLSPLLHTRHPAPTHPMLSSYSSNSNASPTSSPSTYSVNSVSSVDATPPTSTETTPRLATPSDEASSKAEEDYTEVWRSDESFGTSTQKDLNEENEGAVMDASDSSISVSSSLSMSQTQLSHPTTRPPPRMPASRPSHPLTPSSSSKKPTPKCKTANRLTRPNTSSLSSTVDSSRSSAPSRSPTASPQLVDENDPMLALTVTHLFSDKQAQKKPSTPSTTSSTSSLNHSSGSSVRPKTNASRVSSSSSIMRHNSSSSTSSSSSSAFPGNSSTGSLSSSSTPNSSSSTSSSSSSSTHSSKPTTSSSKPAPRRMNPSRVRVSTASSASPSDPSPTTTPTGVPAPSASAPPLHTSTSTSSSASASVPSSALHESHTSLHYEDECFGDTTRLMTPETSTHSAKLHSSSARGTGRKVLTTATHRSLDDVRNSRHIKGSDSEKELKTHSSEDHLRSSADFEASTPCNEDLSMPAAFTPAEDSSHHSLSAEHQTGTSTHPGTSSLLHRAKLTSPSEAARRRFGFGVKASSTSPSISRSLAASSGNSAPLSSSTSSSTFAAASPSDTSLSSSSPKRTAFASTHPKQPARHSSTSPHSLSTKVDR